MSKAEFAGESSDTSKKDDQSRNSSKEDEKRQSGSPGGKSTLVGLLEGDEVTITITPGFSVSWKRDASSTPSKKNEEGEDHKKASIISNLGGDDCSGRSPNHDVGQEDAPSGNNPLRKSTNDKENNATMQPISNTTVGAPKRVRRHLLTSFGGSPSRKISPPVKEFTSGDSGLYWYCSHCNGGGMTIGLDTHCIRCGCRRDAYSSIPP